MQDRTDMLPYLDVTAPGFSTRGPEVLAARDQGWCARTPFGFAVLRHREAGQLLRDRRLRQGSHAWPDTNGLTGSFAEFWKRSVISLEGAPHKRTRALAQQALSPDFIAALDPTFQSNAAELTARIVGATPCEFMQDFSEPFAGQAITTLLGLPESEANWIAADASALGLAMGINCKVHEPTFNAACDRLMALSDSLLSRARAHADPMRFVDRLVLGNDLAQLEDQALRDLIVISIFGGVDTTRAQLGFAMALFAQHPDQWDWLRANPQAIPQAIEEIIRTRPTTTWSTREAIAPISLNGVTIQTGDILHILVHSTGTDPSAHATRPPAADWQFDIRVRRKLHFGFGGGAHHCLGQLVARTDMAAALRALCENVARIEIAAPPDWLPDSGNTSARKLPLLLHPN